MPSSATSGRGGAVSSRTSSTLRRGLYHSMDSLPTCSQQPESLGSGRADHQSPKKRRRPSSKPPRTRYTILEGDGGWGGRVLNAFVPPASLGLELQEAVPRVSRRRTRKGRLQQAPVETTGILLRASTTTTRRRSSPRAPTSSKSIPVKQTTTESGDREWFSKYETRRAASPAEFLDLLGTEKSNVRQNPDSHGSTTESSSSLGTDAPVSVDDLQEDNLGSAGNLRGKNIAGPPSLFSETRPPLDSDIPTSGSGLATRSSPWRLPGSTWGVLPSSAFWSSRSRQPLLGYDFVAGCLDNGETVLDWSDGRLQRLCKDRDRVLSRNSEQGRARNDTSHTRDPQCMHRYRLEPDTAFKFEEKPEEDREPRNGRLDSAQRCSAACCRLCRLLQGQGGSNTPCYHCCLLDIPPDPVQQSGSRPETAASAMTFRPDSLALSQNCGRSNGRRKGVTSSSGARSSSLPPRQTRLPRWRY